MMIETDQSKQSSNIITQIFKSDIIGNNELRIIGTYESPLFIAKDIATILGYKDTKDAVKKHVDEEDKISYIQDDKNRGDKTPPLKLQDGTILINESGLYSLILRSKMEKAKQFKRWVTSEVLPSIRKTGQFKLEQLELQLQEANNTLQIKDKEIKKITESREKLLKRRKRTPYEIGNVFYVVSNISFFIHYDCSYLKPGEATQSNRESDATFITRLSTYSPHNYDVNALFYIEENVKLNILHNDLKI